MTARILGDVPDWNPDEDWDPDAEFEDHYDPDWNPANDAWVFQPVVTVELPPMPEEEP